MNNPFNHFPGSSVTLSMMISEAVYKAIIGVERIIHLVSK
jgi:hypothetical protein